ncbi:hypothetical protein CRUP_011177 [Coryphaenoides rupestris]|nr:hypothetical protein CRUP_011177 [Coryphaenoides rupestris]
MVELLPDDSVESDSVRVSWQPSHYGIAFLRGFQVSLQALGGLHTACQLFLFRHNLSLPVSHAQLVYTSDPFRGLVLGAQYAVTVMALPVPEEWDKFYQSKNFFTRNWYPEHIVLKQQGAEVIVTFNLAPHTLGFRRYFSWCYGPTGKTYKSITPDFSTNKTHCTYILEGLQEGTNYTYAADGSRAAPLALVLPLVLSLVLLSGLLLLFICRRPKLWKKQLDLMPDVFEEPCQDKTTQEVVTLLPRGGVPRLLMCYCGKDGPAHVRAVMQLGAFVQQHMATKTPGHGNDVNHNEAEQEEEEVEEEEGDLSCTAAVALIGEEMGRAKARGKDLSKYMAAIFPHSEETDIPLELGLASRYRLPRDLPLLFSHLHGVALHTPGRYLKLEHLSGDGLARVPAGATLLRAITEARRAAQGGGEAGGGEESTKDRRK